MGRTGHTLSIAEVVPGQTHEAVEAVAIRVAVRLKRRGDLRVGNRRKVHEVADFFVGAEQVAAFALITLLKRVVDAAAVDRVSGVLALAGDAVEVELGFAIEAGCERAMHRAVLYLTGLAATRRLEEVAGVAGGAGVLVGVDHAVADGSGHADAVEQEEVGVALAAEAGGQVEGAVGDRRGDQDAFVFLQVVVV